MQEAMEKYGNEVRSKIISNEFIEAVGIFDPIPKRKCIRVKLARPPINIKNRQFRIIKVEDLEDYEVFIQIPGEKSEYDFFVWRAVYDDGNLQDLKIPSHDDLGRMYLNLKAEHDLIEEYLINATLRFIRDRQPIKTIITRYFSELNQHLIKRIKEFLLTLKWIAIQEDANYPPPNLGSIYSLSVYAILEVTNDLKSIRRIIRFR